MTGIEVIAAIASAINIVKDAPMAIGVLQDLGVSAGLLRKEVEESLPIEIDELQPVDILTIGLMEELSNLSQEYNKRKDTWDQVEREQYQKRVAAKAYELMDTGESLLQNSVKSFNLLREFFCNVVQKN
jgi:hypothetical protein